MEVGLCERKVVMSRRSDFVVGRGSGARAPPPVSWPATDMRYGKDDKLVRFDAIDHGEPEALWKYSSGTKLPR